MKFWEKYKSHSTGWQICKRVIPADVDWVAAGVGVVYLATGAAAVRLD